MAETELQRVRKLHESNAASREEVAKAEARGIEARAMLTLVQSRREEAKIDIELAQLQVQQNELEVRVKLAEASIEMLDAKQQLIQLRAEQDRFRNLNLRDTARPRRRPRDSANESKPADEDSKQDNGR